MSGLCTGFGGPDKIELSILVRSMIMTASKVVVVVRPMHGIWGKNRPILARSMIITAGKDVVIVRPVHRIWDKISNLY